ncbi:sigma 54-interacting transcriptional regulator [Candidatus Laterigemmans baculatus]|uniref:sigma 54-interacting transcriptional regulator n=1 Tax=Candidatus Laterigemmans baculatus TaxID=2770505 RepID=UPI0013DBBF34|nr:sigma 54-interacting transcriptional regulator [Candidatus Laterigemmans baculatus]
MVACSAAMQELARLVRRIAATSAPVLLYGEVGVGKGTLAAAIHALSDRREARFVRCDCGEMTLPELLATVAEAGEGTLYLAEVERLPPELQIGLLHAVRCEANPLGEALDSSSAANPALCSRRSGGHRWIAGCERDLRAEVDAGRFREDLYWALNVIPLEIPPLRNRSEEIPKLVRHFLERSNARNGGRVTKVAPRALEALEAYSWPGNLPELGAYVERAVVMAEGDELTLELLPEPLTGIAPRRSGGIDRFDLASLTEEVVAQGIAAVDPDEPNPALHSRVVNAVERELMLQVLRGCNGVRKQAAARLGINRNTLHKKLKEYGLDSESPEA